MIDPLIVIGDTAVIGAKPVPSFADLAITILTQAPTRQQRLQAAAFYAEQARSRIAAGDVDGATALLVAATDILDHAGEG